MKRYGVFVTLFAVSLLLFFVGTFTGNAPLILIGIALTFGLFVVRRTFLPQHGSVDPDRD